MKLIGSLTSPYVRKARIALAEKNLPYEFVEQSPWAADTRVPDYNPLGKVPALVTDDGTTLFDSNILIDYFEQLRPEPALLPRAPAELLRARQIIALADGTTDAGIAILLEGRRPAEKQLAEWVARQRGKIERGLDALEKTVRDGGVVRDVPDAVDIAVGCLLFWLDFRIADLDWRASRPALRALAERLGERASFRQTVPVE